MKRKKNIVLVICMLFLLTACEEEPSSTETVKHILDNQKYMKISLGEAYHQENVLFDSDNDRAVIPKNARWGRPAFREGGETGIFYGEEEGGELYEADTEVAPELYIDSYLKSIHNLDLKAGDVKRENYVIQVVKKSELEPFAEELVRMSNIVLKNNYKLTGVELTFDKQCRPVRKIFHLQETGENGFQKENESVKCMQEFSYDIGRMTFENALEKVKKEIGE